MSAAPTSPSKRASVSPGLNRSSTVDNLAKGRLVKGTSIEKPPNNDEPGIWAILKHPLNTLIVFLPLGCCAYFLRWGDLFVFWFMFLAMVPLAKILGDATEELAANLKNDMLAGLLNATFGNAVEMVLTIQTLRRDMFDVVKSTLLGSVLSNTLLVLGMSFFAGGLFTLKHRPSTTYGPVERGPSQRGSVLVQENSQGMPAGEEEEEHADFDGNEKIQTYSVLGALVNTSMLLISCTSFSLITLYRMVLGEEEICHGCRERILLPVSRVSSIVIMCAYVAYIFFQLVTHKDAMSEDQGDEEDGEDHLSLMKSIGLLGCTTVVVACASAILVESIEGVTEKAALSEHFIGIILLPIVGNACEHAAAVRFAVQDKMGLSVSIAVGSSTQIALFVVPFSVLVAWVMDKPMDLNFGMFNTSVITLSIIVVLSMVVDGHSNWLQGYLLMSVYSILAVMYWFLPNELNQIT